jgi:phospholipid/cholesterol/gamma-HCH transport system substrate-binding protein
MDRAHISRKVALTLSVTLAVIVLGMGVAYFRSPDSFARKYRLEIYVPGSSGVTIGAPVQLDGIDVGKVEGIDFAPPSENPNTGRSIQLTLSIRKRYQAEIRTDSLATLETAGLLGARFVSISRGFGGAVIAPGGEIPTRVPPLAQVRLNDILATIANASGHQQKQK